MKGHKLTQSQEQTLREQTIDADRPGPVLRDFRTLLDFVGAEGVKAAGKYNLLPINVLEELDRRLSHPLRLSLTMKRPQLRSHPYLQGLHLLLRATGLSRVEGAGAKARLVLDPALRAQWDGLNPTEQFFTLLEAWLRFGKPEMVGERGSLLSNPVLDCLQMWQYLPAQGQQFDVNRPQEVWFLGIDGNLYHLALMDLFGLVQVEHPSQPVQRWCPAAVRHVPFGDALFSLLRERYLPPLLERGLLPDEEDVEEDALGPPSFGAWQPLFQPYFPEWCRNLTFPAAGRRDGVFVFRVSLGKVWRRIAMPASATLDSLVSWILDSVDFDDDHLHVFRYRDRFGATVEVSHPYMDEGPYTDQVHIGDVPLEPGQSMTLVYDFGDDWRFDVQLERIEPTGTRIKAPGILESRGKAPRQYPNEDEW